jgi:carbamoylphosphate synthase small subunit
MFAGDDGDGGDASQSSSSTDDQSAAAIRACLAAVAEETQQRDVAVLSSEYSEANSVVMVGVGAKRAPWRCLSSNDGKVAEIMFAGDDGDGGDSAANQGSSSAGDQSAAAIRACLGAVAEETQERDLAVLSSEYSEANSVVVVGVGAKRAPWRCLSSNDGKVAEVSSMTDEGGL